MKRTASAAFLVTLCLFAAGLDIQKPTVLFDQGHGQKFLIQEAGPLHLSLLSEMFHDARFRVAALTKPISDESLKDVHALVISGPFKPFTQEEIDAVLRFVENGGRLCIMLHIGQPAAWLTGKFNVLVSNGVIQETNGLIDNESKDFYVSRFIPHPLTNGIEKFAVHGGWALHVTGNHGDEKYGTEIALTSPKAWIDLNRNGILDEPDAQQSFAVVVAGNYGKGEFAIFGDDAIFQNSFLEKYNTSLAKNLVSWLVRESAAPDVQ